MNPKMQSTNPAGKSDPSSTLSELRLERAENGGWIIMEQTGAHMMPRMLGADTDHSDMIGALSDMLAPQVKAAPPTHSYPT